MDTILGVNLESPATRGIVHNLIYTGRTVALSWLVIKGKIAVDWYRSISKYEMTGLILSVVGIGQEYR